MLALISHLNVSPMLIEGGEVGMLVESSTFDGFQFGKCFVELAEKFVPLLVDVLFGCGMVWTQQDVAFQEDLGIIPPSSA